MVSTNTKPNKYLTNVGFPYALTSHFGGNFPLFVQKMNDISCGKKGTNLLRIFLTLVSQ